MGDGKKVILIREWSTHYEISDARRTAADRPLPWVAVKTKHDGKGFRRLTRLDRGLEIFGAFVLMVEVAAKMPVRGVLADEDGPLTADDLHDMTGFPSDAFDLSIKTLCDSSLRVNWLEESSYIPRDTSIAKNILSESAPTRQDRTGQDRTGHDTTERGVVVFGIEEKKEKPISEDHLKGRAIDLNRTPVHDSTNIGIQGGKASEKRSSVATAGKSEKLNNGRKLNNDRQDTHDTETVESLLLHEGFAADDAILHHENATAKYVRTVLENLKARGSGRIVSRKAWITAAIRRGGDDLSPTAKAKRERATRAERAATKTARDNLGFSENVDRQVAAAKAVQLLSDEEARQHATAFLEENPTLARIFAKKDPKTDPYLQLEIFKRVQSQLEIFKRLQSAEAK